MTEQPKMKPNTYFIDKLQKVRAAEERKAKREAKAVLLKLDKSQSRKSLKKECDELRRQIIYLRAGYCSEWGGIHGKQIGGTHILHDHHPAGKASIRLRYELENGICLTSNEHRFIAHNPDRAEEFRRWVKSKKGDDFFDRMAVLKETRGADLRLTKIYLTQELTRLKGNKL